MFHIKYDHAGIPVGIPYLKGLTNGHIFHADQKGCHNLIDLSINQQELVITTYISSTAEGRLCTLAERHNVAHLGDIYVQQTSDAINIQVFTPGGFEIQSFHNRQGRKQNP